MYSKNLSLLCIIFMMYACGHLQPGKALLKNYRALSTAEKAAADSILAYALDHEALYTLTDTLKPMSSIQLKRLPLNSTNKEQRDSAAIALLKWQQLAQKMSVGDWIFVVNPFERTDSIYRYMEMYVIRKTVLAKKIQQYDSFYTSMGLSAGAHPATILSVTECSEKYNRWRSYGYLFGYPSYAVDFFVQAGATQDSTGKFVERQFFQIPVYASSRGHFTYAIPKGYQPHQSDSSLYLQAQNTLKQYQQMRARHLTSTGIPSTKIWKKLLHL